MENIKDSLCIPVYTRPSRSQRQRRFRDYFEEINHTIVMTVVTEGDCFDLFQ